METAYEAIYFMETNLPEEQVTATIDKYSGVVTRAGGVVDDIDRLEPRRLAYEVKGRREGLYVVMNFHSEPPAKDELDRIFGISDDVLRHLIVKQDKKADRFPSRARAAENERREREFAARTASTPVAEAQPVTDLPPAPSPTAEAAEADETPPAVTDTPDALETDVEAEEETSEGASSPD